MFHVKEDKRSQKSAELIYKGLSELLEKKSYDSITITDIQRASTVGRATFYRCFDNVNDVLHWQCSLHYQRVIDGYLGQAEGIDNPPAFETYFFHYWAEDDHSRILEQIIGIGHYDMIFSCHFEAAERLRKAFPRNPDRDRDRHFEYYMYAMIGAFVGVLINWIKNGKRDNMEQILKVVRIKMRDDYLEALKQKRRKEALKK